MQVEGFYRDPYRQAWQEVQCTGRNIRKGNQWGRYSSLVVRWARCPAEENFSGRGICPLELTWVLTPFPPNSFGWEYKPKSSLCTHAFHRTDSKDPDVHILDRWILATPPPLPKQTHSNTPSMQHPRRRNVTTSMVGFKKAVTYTKISLKMVNPRDIAGERRGRSRNQLLKCAWLTMCSIANSFGCCYQTAI